MNKTGHMDTLEDLKSSTPSEFSRRVNVVGNITDGSCLA